MGAILFFSASVRASLEPPTAPLRGGGAIPAPAPAAGAVDGRAPTRAASWPTLTATPRLVTCGDLNCIVFGSMSKGTALVTQTNALRPGSPAAANAMS